MKNFKIYFGLGMLLGILGCTDGSKHSAWVDTIPTLPEIKIPKEDLRVDNQNRITTIDSLQSNESLPAWKPLKKEVSDFDAVHYRLAVSLPPACLKTPQFNGDLELTFRPLQNNFQILNLESEGLQINSVTLLNNGAPLNFLNLGQTLRIDLGQAFSTEDTLVVKVKYDWKSNPNMGMYFRSRAGVAETESIYTQSEPDYSRYWFPSNSYPNDRATFESIIEVPKPFVALSNGALVDVQENDQTRTYHWSARIPVASYLYVITAGKYAVKRDYWKHLPVEYYGPTDDIERVAYSLRETPDMINYFSEKIGFNYPYEKYAQAVVPKYQWGGMEHVSATTLSDRTVHGPAEDDQFSSRALVSHELAHQWFGDLLTCRTWDHIWLNEGFASYYEMMFQESVLGRANLYAELEGSRQWYFGEEASDSRPVVFPYFRTSIDDYFNSHAYGKGAWILHMLRTQLGDVTYDKAIRHYVFTHQQKLVTTDDLQKAFEQVTGQDLKWFFNQWVYQPGYPIFEVSYDYNANAKEVSVTVKQTQDLTAPGGVAGTTPLFQGPITMELDGVKLNAQLLGTRAANPGTETFKFSYSKAPRYLKFNSENAWLAKVKTKQSPQAWADQLKFSSDPTARFEAAGEIAAAVQAENTEVLNFKASVDAVQNCAFKEESIWVRTTCIATLTTSMKQIARIESPSEALLAWKKSLIGAHLQLVADGKWAVRQFAVRAVAAMSEDLALPVLRSLLQNETKLRVLVEVIRALPSFPSPETYNLLVSQLARKSYADLLTQETLLALAKLGDEGAFAIGETYYLEPYTAAVRSGAMTLMATLGSKFKGAYSERARVALEMNLTDESYNMRLGAISSLQTLGNKLAIPALKKIMETDVEGRIRAAAERAIRALEK